MYIYYNRNPEHLTLPDCVTRAISTALNITYEEVVEMLLQNGEFYSCDTLCVACYEKLLDYDFKLPHYISNNKSAVEVAKDFPDDILLLRMNGHLSCSIYGNIYDIFDCGDEIVTDFWIVE